MLAPQTPPPCAPHSHRKLGSGGRGLPSAPFPRPSGQPYDAPAARTLHAPYDHPPLLLHTTTHPPCSIRPPTLHAPYHHPPSMLHTTTHPPCSIRHSAPPAHPAHPTHACFLISMTPLHPPMPPLRPHTSLSYLSFVPNQSRTRENFEFFVRFSPPSLIRLLPTTYHLPPTTYYPTPPCPTLPMCADALYYVRADALLYTMCVCVCVCPNKPSSHSNPHPNHRNA